MAKITPCLWYARDAEEAANFYVSLFADARIDHVQRSPADNPGTRRGEVLMVAFTLAGQSFTALNGGHKVEHTDALSLQIECEDQAEVDRLWDAIVSTGGKEVACGWVNDRWGVRWQIVPGVLPRLLADPDPARARRAMEAMMDMTKLDIAALERAAAGE